MHRTKPAQPRTGYGSDNKFVFAGHDEKFVNKELTIHDLDSSNFKPNLETNGNLARSCGFRSPDA